jgi:hypothetical protein
MTKKFVQDFKKEQKNISAAVTFGPDVCDK